MAVAAALYHDALGHEAFEGWQFASEAFPEQEALARQKTAAFLGNTAVRGGVEMTLDMDGAGTAGAYESAEPANESTLLAAIKLAALGDAESLDVVKNNVVTDVAERMYKVAHQTKVSMEFRDGSLGQGGRKLSGLHGNTLRNMVLKPEMLRRTKIELRNALLFEELHSAGALETHDAVVFSPASTTMSAIEKQEYGFFTDTESCSIQVLSADGDKATLQTAMVAGKAEPSGSRHDIQTIHKLAAANGLKLNETDGTEMLQYVMLVPKESVPNGISDIVELYDDAAGGTFYGQAKPRQDYQKYAAECEARNRNFSQSVDTVVSQLIKEAHLLASPVEAIGRLDYLSERVCVQYAVRDKAVDAEVFGSKSAMHIQEARFFMEQGDMGRAEHSLRKAQDTAQSSSCPLFKGSKGEGGDDDEDGVRRSSSDDSESSGKRKMSCPFCKAKVYDDPCAKKLSCWDCKAMVMNGKVHSQGNGGSQGLAEQLGAMLEASRAAAAEAAGKVLVGASL